MMTFLISIWRTMCFKEGCEDEKKIIMSVIFPASVLHVSSEHFDECP